MLTRQQYVELARRLDFRGSPWATAGVAACDWGLLVLWQRLVHRSDAASYLVSQVVLAVVIFHHFSLMHECVHGSAGVRGWANTLVGHYASIFCFLPFHPWKAIHLEHHAWTGALDRDPTLAEVRRIRERNRMSGLARFAWATWLPLLALLQHLVFWLYPMKVWRQGRLAWPQLWRSLVSIACLPAAYVLLDLALPHGLRFRDVGLALGIYLVLVEAVNLPHHSDLPGYYAGADGARPPVWEQSRSTRTCDYPWPMSELVMLNFNFHVEHHLFPTLPWYRLRRARDLVRPVLGADYQECRTVHWMLDRRRRPAEAVFLGIPLLAPPSFPPGGGLTEGSRPPDRPGTR
jgi:fatty acid desaturase